MMKLEVGALYYEHGYVPLTVILTDEVLVVSPAAAIED